MSAKPKPTLPDPRIPAREAPDTSWVRMICICCPEGYGYLNGAHAGRRLRIRNYFRRSLTPLR